MSAEPIDLDAVEALANAATPGPWIDMGDTDVYAGEVRCAEPYTAVCRDPEMDDRPNDRAFIAAARTLVPEMAAEIRALRARVATLEAENCELRATLANERGEGEPPVPGWEYRDPFPDLPRVAEVRDFRTWCHESGLFLRRRDDGTGWRIGKGRIVNGPLYRFARDAMRDVFAAGGSNAS